MEAVEYRLHVDRADFVSQLVLLATTLNEDTPKAYLSFQDGWLIIATDQSNAILSAEGLWPGTVEADTLWIAKMSKNLPPGDPFEIRVHNEKLCLGSFSVPCCVLDPAQHRQRKKPLPRDAWNRILIASEHLEQFHLGKDELAKIVDECRQRHPSTWTRQEQEMIDAISKAWAQLAIFGIEPADLRDAIYAAVRQGMTRNSE
jgi:hypothetical protein